MRTRASYINDPPPRPAAKIAFFSRIGQNWANYPLANASGKFTFISRHFLAIFGKLIVDSVAFFQNFHFLQFLKILAL